MTFEEIKKYLLDDYVVRNYEFEYKRATTGGYLLCREIGEVYWRYVLSIGAYEKKMEWEIVGKK